MKRHAPALTALAAGLVFGLGLAVSGMTHPDKVQNFLDFTGGAAWDPSLAFVMAGAIAAYVGLSRLIRRRKAPLFAARFALPTRTDLDPKLIGGSALFGVGWGLGGICPGPAIVDLGSGMASALVFVVAMAAGMVLQRLTAREGAQQSPAVSLHHTPSIEVAHETQT